REGGGEEGDRQEDSHEDDGEEGDGDERGTNEAGGCQEGADAQRTERRRGERAPGRSAGAELRPPGSTGCVGALRGARRCSLRAVLLSEGQQIGRASCRERRQ